MNGSPTDNARRFDEVIRPHFDALYRAAMRLTRRREDAEDLVQEVLLRAFPALGQLETLESPRGWLLRVQYRIFVDGYRRRQRSPVVGLPEGADTEGIDSDDPGPEALTDAHLCRRQLARVWPSLEREQRALLALHAEGYTAVELAAIAGVSANAVNVRLHRARARLSRLLRNEPAGNRKLAGMEN